MDSMTSTMIPDPQDMFRQSCINAQDYPRNLIDIDRCRPSYATDVEELRVEHDRLWDADRAALKLLELYDGGGDCERSCIRNSQELLDHLQRNQKDPRYRFVFLEADNSRVALNCSGNMFNALATHHQVPPAFISNILSFGEQSLPRDFSLMTFQNEDNLYARDSDLVPLPDLGRSGRDIRYCFNIRTVESSSSEPGWRWSMRNLAIYHSLDVETGRSFWLSVKGNGLIRDRIDKAVNKPLFSPKSQVTIEGSFASSLEILWIVMDWSDENWRNYINDLDEQLGKIVIKAKTAQIDRHAKMPKELIKALKLKVTMEPPKRAATLTEKVQAGVTALVKVHTKETQEKRDSDDEADPEGDKRALYNLSVLKSFSFEELQRLHIIGERLNEALLVLGLTIQTVQSVRGYYTTVFKSDGLPKKIRDGCRPDMALFQQRMGNIERNLQVRQEQVESMGRLAQEAKTLFDGILQYRSMQISLLFAQSGYDSNKKMESIARKTEQETTSMHVITAVTLLFLPPTFLAVSQLVAWSGWPWVKTTPLTLDQSFFQSGLIQVKVPDDIEKDWVMLPGPSILFAEISVGLILLVLVIWWFMYGSLKRRAKKRGQDGSDMA